MPDVVFSDAAEFPAWAAASVQAMANAGLISGYPPDAEHPGPENWFGGDRGVTRFEMAALLERLDTYLEAAHG